MKVHPISFKGVPKNYAVINDTLSRSAQPKKEDFVWLKEHGVTDIINFRTMFVAGVDYDEKTLVEKLGMKYHNIPSITKEPKEENIREFLNIVENVKSKGGKTHIHCKAGADRTGMYAFIYKVLHGLGTIAENETEWIAKGHDIELYPNLRAQAKELLSKFIRK